MYNIISIALSEGPSCQVRKAAGKFSKNRISFTQNEENN